MKKILLLFFMIPAIAFCQQAKISGVVTFFFNKNYGNRPDVSADVYVIDSASADYIRMNDYDSFVNKNACVSIYNSLQHGITNTERILDIYNKRKKKYKDEIEAVTKRRDSDIVESKNWLNKAIGYGYVQGSKKLTSYEDRLFTMEWKLAKDENMQHRTIDGSGNYSIDVNPNTYYVLIRSKNRTNLNMIEINGMIYLTNVIIKPEKTKDVDHNFPVGD